VYLEQEGLYHGYDYFMGLGWRGKDKKTRLFAKDVWVAEGSNDDDWVKADFGEEVVDLKCMCAKELILIQSYKLQSRGGKWEAQVGDLSVRLTARADRHPLWSLQIKKEGTKDWRMRCMIHNTVFDTDADKANVMCFNFMKDIGEAFANKKVTVDELYVYRDAKLKGMGLTLPSKGAVRKRPAAALAEGVENVKGELESAKAIAKENVKGELENKKCKASEQKSAKCKASKQPTHRVNSKQGDASSPSMASCPQAAAASAPANESAVASAVPDFMPMMGLPPIGFDMLNR